MPGTIIVDRTAPSVGKPALGGPDSTTFNGQPVSKTSTPTLEISAEKGSRVSVFEDLNNNGVLDADEKTLVLDHLQIGDRDEVTSALALNDGSYDLRVVAVDLAGNRSLSAVQTISVVATAPTAPTIDLAATDDTGDSNRDHLTNKRNVAILVDGTAGTTVKLFNDLNQNGKEDAGESVGSVHLAERQTQGSVDVQLVDGVNHIRAYTVDVLGRKSAPGVDLALTLEQQSPAAPTMQLAAASDTGVLGDNVTAKEQLALQVSGEAGARFVIFDDRNGNNTMDAGEQLTTGRFTDAPLDVQVSLGEGVHTLQITAQDPAGNVSPTVPYTLTVNHSLPTVIAAKVIELDGRAVANTDVNDSLLPNTSPTGERLTAAHLGLADPAPGDVRITFDNLVNVSVAIDGTVQQGSTSVTLQQVIDGHISIIYSQDNPSLLSGGVFADAGFTVTKPGATTDSMSGSLSFAIHSATGIVAFGDGSGNGGAGGVLFSWEGKGFAGEAGGSGTDRLLGTSHGDLIFGDGSGGGGGVGMSTAGTTGGAGGANDTIAAGAGDDIIFGDGFSGSGNSQGGYGGGGGGGGNGNASAGVIGGIGGGTGGQQSTGGSTTLGAAKNGGATVWSAGRAGGGGGAGVGTGNDYSAEFDGAPNTALHQYDNSGSAASAIAAARSAFLDGPGSGNGENRMFTQSMGVGNDTIDGGDGNDYIMAGNGDDTIIGGRGNDVMYGRGGATNAGTDNDTFVWHRGDAGTGGALDVIRDFGTTSGNQDKLSLLSMLEGRTGPNDDFSQWIQVFNNSQAPQDVAGADAGTTGTLIRIDVDGAGPGQVVQQIYLTGVTLASTDVHTLISNGTIL